MHCDKTISIFETEIFCHTLLSLLCPLFLEIVAHYLILLLLTSCLITLYFYLILHKRYFIFRAGRDLKILNIQTAIIKMGAKWFSCFIFHRIVCVFSFFSAFYFMNSDMMFCGVILRIILYSVMKEKSSRTIVKVETEILTIHAFIRRVIIFSLR